MNEKRSVDCVDSFANQHKIVYLLTRQALSKHFSCICHSNFKPLLSLISPISFITMTTTRKYQTFYLDSIVLHHIYYLTQGCSNSIANALE